MSKDFVIVLFDTIEILRRFRKFYGINMALEKKTQQNWHQTTMKWLKNESFIKLPEIESI